MKTISRYLRISIATFLALTMLVPMGASAAGAVQAQPNGTLALAVGFRSPASVISAGQTNVHMATFTLSARAEAMIVQRISFTKIGSVRSAHIQNIKITDDRGVQLAPMLAALDQNNVATFNLAGLVIPAQRTQSILIIADIAQAASGSFGFSVAAPNALSVVGAASGAAIATTAAKWPTTSTARQVGTFAPQITVARSPRFGNRVMNPGETGTLALFDMSAGMTDDLQVQSITITLGAAAENLTGAYRIIVDAPFAGGNGIVVASGVAGATNQLGGELSSSFVIPRGGVVSVRLDGTISPVAPHDTILNFSLANNQSVRAVGLMSGIFARLSGMFPVVSQSVIVL